MSARTLRRYRAFVYRKVDETLAGTLPPAPCTCPGFCGFCLSRLETDWMQQNGTEPFRAADLDLLNVPQMYRRMLLGAM